MTIALAILAVFLGGVLLMAIILRWKHRIRIPKEHPFTKEELELLQKSPYKGEIIGDRSQNDPTRVDTGTEEE